MTTTYQTKKKDIQNYRMEKLYWKLLSIGRTKPKAKHDLFGNVFETLGNLTIITQ